jgi:hypothetical protein
VITGALVLALRDVSRLPEAFRPDVLWADDDVIVADVTRAALRREPDIDAITAQTLRAAVEHHVPAGAPKTTAASRRRTKEQR